MSAPQLSASRTAVLAALAQVPGSLRAPTVNASGPLTSLPATVEAKLAARAAAGYDPIGADHPRSRTWQQVVLPAGILAVVDAGGSGILLAVDHPWYALVGAVVFVPLAGGAAIARRYAARDPLRLSVDELRAITHASHWESRQVWTGPLSGCDERALVVVAAAAVTRIVDTLQWRNGDHRIRLDLANELTQMDDQAHRIAIARHGNRTPAPPAADQAWAALVDRVAALHAYADALADGDAAELTRRAALGDPAGEAALAAGSARDEFAAEQLRALTSYLDDPPAHGLSLDG